LFIFTFYYFISGPEKTDFLKFSLELVHKLQQSDALEVCWLPKENRNILFWGQFKTMLCKCTIYIF